jgi:hypothetical protein
MTRMEIGLSRGPSFVRAPAVSRQSVVEAAHKPVAGVSNGLAEGERASAAPHRALDAKGPHAPGADPMPVHHDPRLKPDQETPRALGQGRDEEPVRALGEGRAEASAKDEEKPPGAKSDSAQLSEEDQRTVEALQRRDQAVRAHEAAHMAAAGGYAAGGPSYTTQQGPDGRSYAIGGEVPLDMSAERTPEATLRKAQTIRAAAMAPADPSGADKAIAGAAAQMAQSAQAAIAEKAAEASEAALPPEPEVKAKPQPKPKPKVEAKPEPKPEPKVAARQGATSVDGAAEAREGARPEAVEVSAAPEELNASSTEGFAQLREGLTEITATDLKQVAKNKRGKISKAYVAMAQTPARATLKCAACSSFH